MRRTESPGQLESCGPETHIVKWTAEGAVKGLKRKGVARGCVRRGTGKPSILRREGIRQLPGI